MQDQPSQASRRVKTKTPGVYLSISGKYEIQYRDSDGRQRFKTVEGTFEEAKAARAEVLARIRKGEAVRSTRQDFGELAEAWLSELNRRPRTIESYRYALNRHLLPRFKRRKLADIRVEDVAKLVTDMEKAGYSGWTISGTVTVLSAVMRKAARVGLIASNPVSKLERGERPKLVGKEKRILTEVEIRTLLEKAETLHALISVLLFGGLRISEALGLTWEDIDFPTGFVHVRKQLDRTRQRVALKTPESERDVILVSQLGKILQEHRVASRFKAPSDFVFPAPDGRGRDHSATRKGIGRAVERAGLEEQGITAQTFRHTFASLLIVGLELDPARVAAQLGHANPGITLAVYTHLFEQARHAAATRTVRSNDRPHR